MNDSETFDSMYDKHANEEQSSLRVASPELFQDTSIMEENEDDGITTSLNASMARLAEEMDVDDAAFEVAPDPVPMFTQSTIDLLVGLDQFAPTPPQPETKLQTCAEEALTDERYNIRHWGLPNELCTAYEKMGVKQLYPWQMGFLDEFIDCDDNIVYSAPTSGGKTLVAEILMIKRLISRKKALFVVPYVALAEEKHAYFKSLLEDSYNLHVDGAYSTKQSEYFEFEEVDLIICTIERANGIINRFIENGQQDKLGSVVVDELHMLGEVKRGAVLELLLSKILFCTAAKSIQIIGMSATLPNLEDVANWLRARLFITNYRPVPLTEYMYYQGKILSSNATVERELPINSKYKAVPELQAMFTLIDESLQTDGSVLVFAHTKKNTTEMAEKTANHLAINGNYVVREELCKRLAAAPTGFDTKLAAFVRKGVAYHHAGLALEERRIIEMGYRSGAIRVLFATSTLSAGVNFPARRVIFTPCDNENAKRTGFNIRAYKQSAGRAGRAGKDSFGESFFLAISKTHYDFASKMLKSPMPKLISALMDKGMSGMYRFLVENIAYKLARNTKELEHAATSTLCWHQESPAAVKKMFGEAAMQLYEKCVLSTHTDPKTNEITIYASDLGHALFQANVDVNTGISLFKMIETEQMHMLLDSDLHLLYILVASDQDNRTNNTPAVRLEKYIQILDSFSDTKKPQPGYLRVAHHFGISSDTLQRLSRFQITGTEAVVLHNSINCYFMALILVDILKEKPIATIEKEYEVERGRIQKIQQHSETMCAIAETMCRYLNWYRMHVLFQSLKPRLKHGCEPELVPLLQIPGLTPSTARILYKSKLATIYDIANASDQAIADILTSNIAFVAKTAEADKRQALKQAIEIKKSTHSIITEEIKMHTRIVKKHEKNSPLRMQSPKMTQNQPRTQKNLFPQSNAAQFKSPQRKAATPTKQTKMEAPPLPARKPFLPINGAPPAKRLASSTDAKLPLPKKSKPTPITAPPSNLFEYSYIQNDEELKSFVELWAAQPVFAFHVHVKLEEVATTKSGKKKKKQPEAMEHKHQVPEIKGMAICWPEGFGLEMDENTLVTSRFVKKLYYVSFEHVNLQTALPLLQPVLEAANTKKICFAMKDALVYFSLVGVNVRGELHDPRIAAWMVDPDATDQFNKQNPNENSIEKIANEVLQKNSSLIVLKGTYSEHQLYMHQAAQTWILMLVLFKQLQSKELVRAYLDVEMPIVGVLADLQHIGIGFDPEAAKKLVEKLKNEAEGCKVKAKDIAKDSQFNINSPNEVAILLYDKLGYTVPMLRVPLKRGRPTSKEALDLLSQQKEDKFKVLELIRHSRKVVRALKSDAANLHRFASRDPESDEYRIRGNFLQTAAATGRLAVVDPNLQNLCKPFASVMNDSQTDDANENDDENAEEGTGEFNTRQMLCARKGYVFLSADYSQIEVRMLAELCRDPKLVSFMQDGGDMLARIASQIYGKKEQNITEEERNNAKRIVYGLMYGMGVRTLATRLKMQEFEADNLLRKFFKEFAGVSKFFAEVIKKCREDMFVTTLYGRKRFISAINSTKEEDRAKAERVAKNTVCQGSAADLMKIAMIQVQKKLRELNEEKKELIACMVNSIHDELVFEVKDGYENKVAYIVRKCMEQSLKLSVPTPIRLKLGKHFGCLQEFK